MKKKSSLLSERLRVFVETCLSAVLALACSAVGTAASATPFLEKVSGPLTISIYQEPTGFTEQIRALDLSQSLKEVRGWQPFREADVWVYFLKNQAEVVDLGGGIPELFSSTFGKEGTTEFSYRIDLSTNSGKRVLLLFFFFNGLDENEKGIDAITCRAALTTTNEIAGLPTKAPLKELFKSCPSPY